MKIIDQSFAIFALSTLDNMSAVKHFKQMFFRINFGNQEMNVSNSMSV